MDSLYIVMPAYNEEANIEDVVKQWYPILDDKDEKSLLIISDSGSTDSTHEILIKLQETYPKLRILSNTGRQHGPKIIALYEYSIKCDADYIFQTDSDGQTVPEEFEQFWEQRSNYDMIIGHRAARQDGMSRIFVTKILKLAIKVCFGVTVVDANTPFRLMNTKILSENIKLIPKDFNLSNVILSVIYTKKNLRIKYVPITFKPRQGGVNSINLKKIFVIGIKAIKDFREINKMLTWEDCK